MRTPFVQGDACPGLHSVQRECKEKTIPRCFRGSAASTWGHHTPFLLSFQLTLTSSSVSCLIN